MIERRAEARWDGDLKSGRGSLSTESRALDAEYSAGTRFRDEEGTNPEELIAAAHAGCFTMALASELVKKGMHPDTIRTTAAVTLDREGEGWTVRESRLDVVARVPGAQQSAFQSAAGDARTNCPISKLLRTNITMNAVLSGEAPAQQESRTAL